MSIRNVHDLWTAAAEQVERLKKDHKEVARTHEMGAMFGKMNAAMKLKLESLKACKIAPDVKNMPEVMSAP